MPLIRGSAGSDPEQIVIFRALQLGDMLNAVPAFRSLRAAFPESQISLVGLPWAKSLVERYRSYLDGFICFPGFPGFPEQTPELAHIPQFLRLMQAMHFDLALQMHGAGEISNPLISLWGARQNAGFYQPGHYCPDPDLFLEYPDEEPEIWRHLRLMEFLGIPIQGDELEFPLYEEDWQEFNQLREDFHLQERYVCIHPGASRPERRWTTEKFAVVADELAGLGVQVLLTGTEQERHLTGAVAQKMSAPVVDLAGKTSLGSLGALLSSAHLLVSNDTGVSHVAAALKTPSVILFSADDMDRWAPKDSQLHKVIWPAAQAKPEDVLSLAEQQLETAVQRAS